MIFRSEVITQKQSRALLIITLLLMTVIFTVASVAIFSEKTAASALLPAEEDEGYYNSLDDYYEVEYGDVVGSITLPPRWNFSDVNVSVGDYTGNGFREFDAYYTPSDGDLYAVGHETVKVRVKKAPPVVNPLFSVGGELYAYADIPSEYVIYTSIGALPPISLSEGDTEGSIFYDDYVLTAGAKGYGWTFSPTSDNYLSSTGSVIFFATAPTVYSLQVKKNPTKTTYKAFEQFDRQGMEIELFASDGRSLGVTNDYTIQYATNEQTSLLAGDTFVKAVFGNVSVNVPIGVNRIVLAFPSAQPLSFVYDGTEKTVTIAESDLYTVGNTSFDDEEDRLDNVTTEATAAGEYIVRFRINDGANYCFDGGTSVVELQWSIGKATYDMSGVRFLDGTYKWSGTAYSLSVDGIPNGVEVEYQNNIHSEVGVYTVRAIFHGDENHYEIPDLTAILTVTAVVLSDEEIDLSNLKQGDTLPKLTKENFIFGGWYDNSDCLGEAITQVGALNNNVKLYAKWTPVPIPSEEPEANTPSVEDDKLTGGQIASIVIGSVVGAFVLATLGIQIGIRIHRKRKAEKQ